MSKKKQIFEPNLLDQTLDQDIIYISFYYDQGAYGEWKWKNLPIINIFKGIKISQVVQLLHPYGFGHNYFDFDIEQMDHIFKLLKQNGLEDGYFCQLLRNEYYCFYYFI